MAVLIGDDGGIAIGAETVWGTAAVTKIWQHAISTTLGLRKNLIKPGALGTGYRTYVKYGVGFSDGNIVVAHAISRAITGEIYESFGTLATNTFTFGDGGTPAQDSVTIWVNLGGLMHQHVGCIGNSLRWDFAADKEVVVTAGFLGKAGTNETPVTPAPPAESTIFLESDMTGTMTMGGTSVCVLGGNIEVQTTVEGSGRHCIGGAAIKKPVRVGRQLVRATFNVELDTTAGESAAQLLDFINGVSLGDIIYDDWTLYGCYMTGDVPSLGSGIMQFPINVEAQYCELVTTA